MELGFNSLKDISDVVVIPLVLAILALAWPSIQSWTRGRAFKCLILRELGELKPYPKEMQPGKKWWWDHQNKTFIHQKIFQNPTENRDFILSLDPNLVYFVSQLWDARKREEPDGEQWLNYLISIRDNYSMTIDESKKLPGKKEESKPENGINRVYNDWYNLIVGYNPKLAEKTYLYP